MKIALLLLKNTDKNNNNVLVNINSTIKFIATTPTTAIKGNEIIRDFAFNHS